MINILLFTCEKQETPECGLTGLLSLMSAWVSGFCRKEVWGHLFHGSFFFVCKVEELVVLIALDFLGKKNHCLKSLAF